MKIGDRFLVFDAFAWFSNGGDDGDNSCFWKPATVRALYYVGSPPERVADVRFDGTGTISAAHFTKNFRPLPEVRPAWEKEAGVSRRRGEWADLGYGE